MSGLELLVTLRERYPTIPRVLLTAETEPDVRARAIEDAGVFRFLAKPCPAAELLECVEAVLGTRDVSPAAHVHGR